MKIYNIGVNGFNAYLLCGKKNVIIDTVPKIHITEFFKNISEHISLFELDFIIFTRTTPDAVGVFSALLKELPKLSVFASVAGLKNLKEIANVNFCENVVKNEGILDLGEDLLKFFITPNLSWPDTFTVYLESEKALFSGNLFCDSPEKEYFQKEFLEGALKRLGTLSINSFYPGYKTFAGADIYREALELTPEEKLAIVYSTTSGATGELSKAVCLEALASDVSAVLLDANKTEKAEILNTLNACKYWAFGTPTINHNADKYILDIISDINVLKNSEKKAFIFGSYGWSGEGVNIISNLLQNLKIKTFKKPYRCIFNPSPENLEDLKKEVRIFLKEVQDNA